MILHSAPWVVPIDRPVIADGSIVVAEGRIVEVGQRTVLLKKYPHLEEFSYSCVLMPGLVNAHMHLELSHLAKKIDCLPGQKFTDWINDLLKLKENEKPSRKKLVETYLLYLRQQHELGVALIGDIGNDPLPELLDIIVDEDAFYPSVIRMIEYLAPGKTLSEHVLDGLPDESDEIRITCHAPYSTGPEVLLAVKKRCNRLGHVFSIHASESPDEAQFIQDGTGIFHTFLQSRGSWDGLFPFPESSFSSTIDYFDHLGILDENTLLVHCVHLTEDDVQVVKERGCCICLCPGSNSFLGNGEPPLVAMLGNGLLPGLGTDSICSNETLDVWREMQLLAIRFSEVAAERLLAMATEGGARGLGVFSDYGSLTAGKKAKILHVTSTRLVACKTELALLKELVLGGKPTEIQWLESLHQ